ncbi:uncharacterized protein [Pleurodeles waltl]|uniref:uncharacterized protein n=1 Tax=Pleurodeles waltl TaxID=8319 RepID=UPI0037095CB5
MLEIGQCRRAVRVCLPAARCYCRPPCLFSIRGRRRAAVEAGKAAESGPSTGAGADGFAGPTALTTSAGASSDSASVDAAAGVDEGGVSASAEAGCAIPAVSLSGAGNSSPVATDKAGDQLARVPAAGGPRGRGGGGGRNNRCCRYSGPQRGPSASNPATPTPQCQGSRPPYYPCFRPSETVFQRRFLRRLVQLEAHQACVEGLLRRILARI